MLLFGCNIIKLIFLEYSIQQHTNTQYFHVYSEHLPKEAIFLAIRSISTNLKTFSSQEVCSLTIRSTFSYRELSGKSQFYCLILNNTILNNSAVKEISRRNFVFLFTENGNKACQNLWGAAKAILTGAPIALTAYIKK